MKRVAEAFAWVAFAIKRGRPPERVPSGSYEWSITRPQCRIGGDVAQIQSGGGRVPKASRPDHHGPVWMAWNR